MSTDTRRLDTSPAALAQAAALIRDGRLVAFPTETVYGLGANALDPDAVQRIFVAKGRPANDPLIVHVASAADIVQVVAAVPPLVARLAAAFWPGPLTLILPRGALVPAAVSAGRQTVAVRVPRHPVAQALIRAAGAPIAAPSANRFGHTSPTTAAHVLGDLAGRIDAVLDGGPTTVGVESTVLDLTTPVPTLLRPGGVSLEQLRQLIGDVAVGGRAAQDSAQPSPGMLDSHYAPESTLWLCIGPPAQAQAWVRERARSYAKQGQRVGLLVPDEDAVLFADLAADIERLGPADDLTQIARRLYAALRALDARRPDVILARDLGEAGLARAVRDRLSRAASGRVVHVEAG